MRFYVVRPFRHGEEYLKPRSYVDMSYEEARPHILKRKLVLSQEQPPEETVQEEPPTRSGKSSGKNEKRESQMLSWLKRNKKPFFAGFLVCVIVVSVMAHSNRFRSLIIYGTGGVTLRANVPLTVGTDGDGADVTFYSDTAGDNLLWDTSAEALTITGTNGQDALNVDDGNVDIADDIDVDGTSNFDVVDIDGAVDMATTLGVTGVTTLTGGVAYATMSTVIWAAGGPVVLATAGTDQAPTDGPRQWVEVQIPYNVTLTGIGYLVGSVGGTDSVIVELYNSAGTAVARSVSGDGNLSDLVGTAAQFQKVPFSSTYNAVVGQYFISIQMNGTTARLRTYPIPGSGFIANTAAGTYSTGAAITPGTTFVADEGPISFVY